MGLSASAACEFEFFVFDETPDSVRAKGYRPSDNYFHLAPGFPVSFRLDPLGAPRTLRAKLEPLNASAAAPIRLCAEEADA